MLIVFVIGCSSGSSDSTSDAQRSDGQEKDVQDSENSDTTPPNITLLGDSIIYLEQGDDYVELGANAFDDEDGVLSVTVSGSVDTNTVATYTITYEVTDRAGNTTITQRTVIVSLPVSVDSEAPQFEGFALLVSTDTNEIRAAWIAATDNIDSADEITYKIYASTIDNFVPDSATLINSYVGQSSADLTGFNAGTEYFFKIIAIDSSGNTSDDSEVASVSTPLSSPKRSNTIVNTQEELNLESPDSLNGDTLVFQTGSDSQAPSIGSILIGQDVDGNSYLKKVKSVSRDANEIQVLTEQASLSEVFDSASISSELVLRSSQLSTSNKFKRRNFAKQSTSFVPSLNSGTHITNQEWKGGLLSITEKRNLSTLSGGPLKASFKSFNTDNIDISAGQSESLRLTGNLGFEPTINSDIQINALRVASAKLSLAGELSIDLALEYNYDGQIEVTDSKDIFERTYTLLYYVAGVPVYQEVTLKLVAEFSGKATTSISAKSEFSSSVNVSIQAEFDGSSWSMTDSAGLEKELTVSAKAHGSATAEVRLVPEISSRFYKALASTMSVEPYTNATVEARAMGEVDLVKGGYVEEYGFTQFDAFLGVDINMVADLSIFGQNVSRYPESGKLTLYNYKEQLFGLPKLVAEAKPTKYGYRLSAKPEPFISEFGLVNDFDRTSAKWVIFPSGEEFTGLTANIEDSEPEKIYFIGNSEMLGRIGRQFIEVPFQDRCIRTIDTINCYYDFDMTVRKFDERKTSSIITVKWYENTQENRLLGSYSFYPDNLTQFIRKTVATDSGGKIEGYWSGSAGQSSTYVHEYHPNGRVKSTFATVCSNFSASNTNNFFYERYYDEEGNIINDENGSSFHNMRRYIPLDECPTYEDADQLVEYDINNSIYYKEYLEQIGN